jgi:hypothetical protein
VPEGLDQRKGLERAAHVDGGFLAFQVPAQPLEFRQQDGEFVAHHGLGAGHDARVPVLEVLGTAYSESAMSSMPRYEPG